MDHTTDAAAAVALALLPGVGPARLLTMLRACAGPAAAWAAVLEGKAPTADHRLRAQWRAAAMRLNPDAALRRCVAADIAVTWIGSHAHPPVLANDHEPPAVAFHRGDPAVTRAGPRVAIVGTRRCTAYGTEVARAMGSELAAAGVVVVSGLALGVDGAAHVGALTAEGAPVIGVVGSGLDVVYPRQHKALWNAVAERGLLIGEAPPGAAPERWRFPARNRIIAAIADAVVVVESHTRGGSLSTVDAALARDRPILAVPGSVRSPASMGTNELLAQGATPARDAGDVLVALGLNAASTAAAHGAAPPGRAPPADPVEAAVLAALATEPATTDLVAARAGVSLGAAATALARMQATGRVRADGSWWVAAS
jgi:DNA processing protein